MSNEMKNDGEGDLYHELQILVHREPLGRVKGEGVSGFGLRIVFYQPRVGPECTGALGIGSGERGGRGRGGARRSGTGTMNEF